MHIRATLSSAPGGKFQFSAFVGPSFFSVNQGLVDSVSWTDSYPYDTASFTKATTSTFSASKVGFEGGADVAYYFSRNIGIGLMAAVAKAEVSGTNSDKTTISVSVGGSTVGAGLRLRF